MSFGEIVYDGSLWLSIPVAALAGLVSFASPCVLPLVPGYLGYVTGLSGTDSQHRTRRTVAGIGLFVLGFSFIFVMMSVILAQIGAAPWLKGQSWVQVVLGVLVMLMGLVFMGRFSWFQRDRKIQKCPPAGLWGAPFLGMTFGLGWAPCIGPTFAAVQTLVYLDGSNLNKAIILTTAYCLGLGIPFLLVALGIARGATTFSWVRKHHLLLQRIGGIVLIVIGAMMASGIWMKMMSWFQATLPTYELPI
ncbi:cytochrome c biogenesis CcdA family protein [Rothia aerolata]|uniref:Cytochrome C biogenesis protein CcdA n=1 Tax=Rothia aerolata TaxID=1812262 RepID=A0A917IS37_9MICC|nr:cytochrome c biogenesis CcdA family protein [Rothia aerolata]GGH61062.1 cytochrome C biogenesis protein CcdA [Rothia aerolata]